jgi:hypothetical protein
VAERVEFGKVVDRQEDFISLLRLMDLVRPIMPPPARNELVLYAASTVRHHTSHISLYRQSLHPSSGNHPVQQPHDGRCPSTGH